MQTSFFAVGIDRVDADERVFLAEFSGSHQFDNPIAYLKAAMITIRIMARQSVRIVVRRADFSTFVDDLLPIVL